MKRLVYLSILSLLVIFLWSFNPLAEEAKALTVINLVSPADSTKVTTAEPTFVWTVNPGLNDTPKRFNLKLASDPNCASPFWEDTVDASITSIDYDGDPLTQWRSYYWTVKVELDTLANGETITFWQEETPQPSSFFYTTATLFLIPDSITTIQGGIVWAESGDTILVEPGIYHENLLFYKSDLLVTSRYLYDQDTSTINSTIIDGSGLTRGEENGSVVYFSSAVDSTSTLMGFTIRGGRGTEKDIGGEKKINGGGIFCNMGSSPTIIYNVITDNQAEDDGGGIFIYSAAPNILHNIITNNSTVNGSGGAIQCYYSIEVKASPSFSPKASRGEDQNEASSAESGSDKGTNDSISPLKSSLKMSDDEIKNSLNPRDITEVSSASHSLAKPAQNNPPVAICPNDSMYGDTLVGFTTSLAPYTPSDTITLDASMSFDPDSGDSVERWIWVPKTRNFPTRTGWLEVPFFIYTDPTKPIQKITSRDGGLLKFYLKVVDSYGDSSLTYDSVYFSIQFAPIALAGKDTILLPQGMATLNGNAREANPDQINSLKYNWRVISSPTPVTPQPSDTSQSIYFNANKSGEYKLELIVYDGFALSLPDTVKVTANALPVANVVNVPHAFEGDSVYLDASASRDPDSADFEERGLTFSWSVESKPPTAETPVIVDKTQPIAKFVPYGNGTYVFRVEVHDPISKGQPLGGNSALLTVQVDSTYAYPIIQGNLISHNYSATTGGGIDCNGSSPDIINNVFYKNQSQLSGGGIACRNLAILLSTPQIKSNIFFGNVSSDSTGGGIANLVELLSPSATRGFRKKMSIQYNDFWDNKGGALYEESGDISYNIYVFPRLIDPDFGDFRFECSSPCLGAGDPLHPDIGSLIFFDPDTCASVKALEMISLSLFQNPVATAVAHFIVNTDVPLKEAPKAYVTIGELAPSPVYFTPISSKSYRGTAIFSASGSASISVLASSLLEKDTVTTRDFSVELIGTGKMDRLVSTDQKLEMLFPQGSVKEEIYATCISVSQDSRYRFEQQSEMIAYGEAYQLGPSTSFDQDLTISFPLDQLNLKNEDKTLFSVFKYDDGKWTRQESFLDGNSVCAKVKSLGVYRLIYDPRGKHIAGKPETFELFQNQPNPFNPETQIRYDLPVSGHVRLAVYNILGQKVRILVDEIQDAGHKSVIWDGRDDGGRDVASGIYFYKIEMENFEKIKKMVLLK